MGSPRQAGNVSTMKADSAFLGAEDIMGRGDVRVRVVEVLSYPKGTIVAGRSAKKAFPALVLDVMVSGAWRRGQKHWILNNTVRRQLITRAESVHAQDWRGMEADLYCEVTRSPQGGLTWGIRVRPTAEERDDRQLAAKMQRAADRVPPEERDAPSPEPQDQAPSEPDEPEFCAACRRTEGQHEDGCPEAPSEDENDNE